MKITWVKPHGQVERPTTARGRSGDRDLAGMLWSGSLAFMLAAFASIAIIPGRQTYIWLKTGIWASMTVSDALSFLGIARPALTWVGVQKCIDYGLSSPLSLSLFVLFALTGLLFSAMANSAERSRL